MSYVVEQKIKGRIYLYEVENFWDKKKKQPRQKRKYIGPKERIYNKPKESNKVKTKPSNLLSKSYGDIFVTNYLLKELGVADLIEAEFVENYKEILALTSYTVQESSASYLFPYWHEEHYLKDVRKLNSQNLSELYEKIGRHEFERVNFLKNWSHHVNPTSGIYYDITSISSYSTNIESVEWGYNRDGEYLPQINMGLLHCSKTSLPISYRVHPGSIVDVSTLKNTIKTFDIFGLKDLFFILDRGFCSVANIIEMHKNKMSFIQPLSFSLNKAKELLLKHKSDICKSENLFRYKEEVLYHTRDNIELEGVKFDAHIYYNEKASINYKHYLYKAILEIEEEFIDFKNNNECQKYIENNINCKYKKYFLIKDKKIIRNEQEIENVIFRAGAMIFIVNGKKDISNFQIIQNYRNRDKVEKEMNSLKNHLDNRRIRAHSQDTADGRIFIKFLSLILHTKILNLIKNHDKLKNYSLNEIMAELRNLKIVSFGDGNKFLTELSKKQKIIFDAFNIDLHSLYHFDSNS